MPTPRELFTTGVLARDGYRCVICRAPAVDAHHLMERKLFPDGGYDLNNGASVCTDCHIAAEETRISPAELRRAAKITCVVLPPQLTPDEQYDKWGNVMLPNGTRVRGELFETEPVQRVLARAGMLALFTPYVKSPRIAHLPWSEVVDADDLRIIDAAHFRHFRGRDVVCSVKYDGENASLYTDYVHARSLSGLSHPSQSKLKAFHATIAHDIPVGWRVNVENVAAVHTIRYQHLPSLFPVTAIWNASNWRLPWDEVTEWAALLGLPTAKVLYRGPFDEDAIRACYLGEVDGDPQEGYVVCRADAYHYSESSRSIAKFVSQRFRTALEGNQGVHWASKVPEWNRVATP